MFSLVNQESPMKEEDCKIQARSICLQGQEKYTWFIVTSSREAVALLEQYTVLFVVEQIYIIYVKILIDTES